MLCTVIFKKNASNNALYYLTKEKIRIRGANKSWVVSFLTLSMRWSHLNLFSESSNTSYIVDLKSLKTAFLDTAFGWKSQFSAQEVSYNKHLLSAGSVGFSPPNTHPIALKTLTCQSKLQTVPSKTSELFKRCLSIC